MKPQRTRPAAARRIRPLSETLAYENDLVVYKFMERYKLSFRQANDVFTETKRWLWLCARALVQPSGPQPLFIIGMKELGMIDEMWHTFLLFTPVYAEFCEHHFGRFIHHLPSTRDEQERARARRRADPEGYEREQLAAFRKEIAFVGQELGAATLRKWFTTYGGKYTPEKMDLLRIPHAR